MIQRGNIKGRSPTSDGRNQQGKDGIKEKNPSVGSILKSREELDVDIKNCFCCILCHRIVTELFSNGEPPDPSSLFVALMAPID